MRWGRSVDKIQISEQLEVSQWVWFGQRVRGESCFLSVKHRSWWEPSVHIFHDPSPCPGQFVLGWPGSTTVSPGWLSDAARAPCQAPVWEPQRLYPWNFWLIYPQSCWKVQSGSLGIISILCSRTAPNLCFPNTIFQWDCMAPVPAGLQTHLRTLLPTVLCTRNMEPSCRTQYQHPNCEIREEF